LSFSETDNTIMIELTEISKVFRNKDVDTKALSNISLTIADGEFVSIMGPSGCGKTTLLNIIGLIETPTSGKYRLDKQLVSGLSERDRTGVRKDNFSFVFQSFNLIDELTIRENIELPLIYQKVPSVIRNKSVDEVIEKFNLKHRAGFFPNELSGGQQQRAAIARAVVAKPRIILADEPTGNLDSTQGEEVIQHLTKLNENGTTIVMVTHSMMQAQRTHRIIHLFDGHIVTESYSRSAAGSNPNY
jgi:putative ABC transport system ATP-binding protein